MKLLTILATVGLAATSAFARCGTPPPDNDVIMQHKEALLSQSVKTDANKQRVVDTYINVVTSAAKRNKYTKAMIQEQMAVMNSRFKPLGVSFNTISITFTVNDTWASATVFTPEDREMKAALRKGTYSTLNLFFCSDTPLDFGTGSCLFPKAHPTSTDRLLDGCTCAADTVPGGDREHFNLGITCVHETGHWFGLYHPFNDYVCSGNGDYIDDTPLQGDSTKGCPIGRDTCPDSPGLDSIHNYMDYSWDSCTTEFTPMQIKRALRLYDALRAGK